MEHDHESKAGKAGDAFVVALRELTDAERLEALAVVYASYCMNCGRYHGDQRTCQCWNDE